MLDIFLVRLGLTSISNFYSIQDETILFYIDISLLCIKIRTLLQIMILVVNDVTALVATSPRFPEFTAKIKTMQLDTVGQGRREGEELLLLCSFHF